MLFISNVVSFRDIQIIHFKNQEKKVADSRLDQAENLQAFDATKEKLIARDTVLVHYNSNHVRIDT